MIKIRLPWPDSALSPNSRSKWRRIEANREARDFAYLTTKALLYDRLPMDSQELQLTVTACPPDKRHRDLDNVPIKSYVDGIFLALGMNDKQIKRIVREWGNYKKPGEIVMTLEELR